MGSRRSTRSAARAAVLWVGLALAAASSHADEAPRWNGFDLEGAHIDASEVRAGGPPRDGIPALDAPDAAPLASAGWSPETVVIGVERGGVARAYPVPVLDWHELVNDTLGGEAILVSWCPLCGTGMVFARGDRHFGVSGLLYRSDLLMYDRETESLWSQIRSAAVSGPSAGQRLPLLRSRIEPLGLWATRHPQTTVITRRTGHARDYRRSPYRGYAQSPDLVVPMEPDDRYHAKMPTLGLRAARGQARAYPASELVAAGGGIRESFAGHEVSVRYDPDTQVFDVEAPASIEVVEGFWFAWAAFHPATTVFRAPAPREAPATGLP